MTDTRPRSRGLGRGLSALMSDVGIEPNGTGQVRRPDTTVPIENLVPNPDQPRRSFDPEALAELTSSIREKGIIQPLIVRPRPNQPDSYEIVAGERRWRAAQAAQVHEVPVIVRDYDDTELLEIAIIENIQRADLNPIDEAAGYQQLMVRFGHTQDQLGTALGKSRSHIANTLRLLNLPDHVQTLVTKGLLSAGHARALVGHPKAVEIADRAVQAKLSVREVERLARSSDAPPRPPSSRGSATKDADTIQLERELAAHLGLSVSIDQSPGRESGTVTLGYKSLEQLDDLLRLLSGD